MKTPGLLFLSSLLLLSTIVGQERPKDSKRFDVETNLLVLDEKGEYVSGIKATDIKLFEADVEQPVTSLTELKGAVDISIVADNTGSVRTQLTDITSIGKLIITNLRPDDSAQLIRFVGRDTIETSQLWTNDRGSLITALDNMYIEGGQSAVLDALYLATEDIMKRREKFPDRRYAIVLLSDGEDRNSYYSEKQLFKLLENSHIQVFTITLTKNLPKDDWVPGRKTVGSVIKLVNRLAASTGGTSVILKEKSSNAELIDALRSMLLELRSQYVIRYTTGDIKSDNNVRKLSVTVADGPSGEKRKVHIKDKIVLVPPK